jgi:hypothetical protein
MVSDRIVGWQLRDHLDDTWRSYGRAALELRMRMRESGAGAMSHSGDDLLVENAGKKLDAAYNRYQQAFNTLTCEAGTDDLKNNRRTLAPPHRCRKPNK